MDKENKRFTHKAIMLVICIGMIQPLYLSCSGKFIKTYDNSGRLKEIQYTSKDRIDYKMHFDYNNRRRRIKITKVTVPGKRTVLTLTLKYRRNNKVSFLSTVRLVSPKSSTKEIVYESFYYTRSGRVYKIETSYKNSYSISKNKTALLTTQYRYRRGRISKILVRGDTIKKSMTLTREGANLTKLLYKSYSMDWRKRAFTLQKHMNFHFKDAVPASIVDIKGKGRITNRKKVNDLFVSEGIAASIHRKKFAKDYKSVVNNIEYLIINDQ